MSKNTKNKKLALKKINHNTKYNLKEAISLVKDITYTKFDASIDLSINLGVDPRKPEHLFRGNILLPHGTGKILKILALVPPNKELLVKNAGANYVGLDNYIEKIKNGWIDFDIIVTMPTIMIKLGPLGRILGPRGFMPNPKTGTVTNEPEKSIKEIKSGKINFKIDKYGIAHIPIGRCSFSSKELIDNIRETVNTLYKLKPSSVKGNYIKKIYLSSTMSYSLEVDVKIE